MSDQTFTTHHTTIDTEITYLKGVGPQRGRQLREFGITLVSDILYHFPRRYLDRTNVKQIRDLRVGDEAVIVGRVETFGVKPARKRQFFQLTISDQSGTLKCVWFHGVSWISDKFTEGELLAVFGKVEFYNGMKIIHPEFDLLEAGEDPVNTGQIIPLYPSTSNLKAVGLDSRGIRKVIRTALEITEYDISDHFSDSMLSEEKLIPHRDAIIGIHAPHDHEHLKSAITRLKYDEHFFMQLLMALKKQAVKERKGRIYAEAGPYVKRIYDSLNFEMTNAQIKVLKEIRSDLETDQPMNRLLQGDVGSGKTIVAMLAASIVIGHEAQVAVMAPTEILTEQHFNSFRSYCDDVEIKCAMLTGSMHKKDREVVNQGLADGSIQLVVGTHALIQEGIIFQNLGLIIVDEQHRFGVEHRKKLIEKSQYPEVLAMTATPIPRTLSFTLHGDMDISIIDEMPKDRLPIITKVVEQPRMKRVYQFMQDEMEKGRQCFVVYPLIEESEKMDLKAAETGYELLKNKIFPNFSVGYINGRLSKEERDFQMQEMKANRIQCMVATTVIEVGIDIPNSTVMLIENAERFGLTQLHQLRGRIGRGKHQSYCVLVQHKHTDDANFRLSVMEKTSNGFEISDEDLKLRGPGEFFGTRQHGYLKSKIVDFIADGPIIRKARSRAFQIVVEDPHLNSPAHARIRDQFTKNYKHMLEFVNIS